MLRNHALLLLLTLIAACTKPAESTTVEKPAVYHSVPNLAADTLVTTTYANNIYVYDTVFTFNDTVNTYLKYKGVMYVIRAYEEKNKRFTDSTGYYYCTLFDSGGNMINPGETMNLIVTTAKKFDPVYKTWSNTQQSVEAHFAPFPADAAIFLGLKK